jgi:hypothetical protein
MALWAGFCLGLAGGTEIVADFFILIHAAALPQDTLASTALGDEMTGVTHG